MTTPGTVTLEVRDHLLLMGLSRTAKMNAFDPPMLAALAEAYTRLEREPDLWCGVLFAHGPHFTAGLDLALVAPMIQAGARLFPEGSVDPFGLHAPKRTKPVVCAVQGRCLTIGIELALSQDLTVASEDTRFGQIEIKRGIFPFGGATLRWVSTCGWGNAMRYLLTGDELGAEEALRIGLVQEVVPAGQALARAVELAQKIAAQAPLGVQATLRSARTAVEEGFVPAVQGLYPEIVGLMKTADADEGVTSFVERRTGKFTGK